MKMVSKTVDVDDRDTTVVDHFDLHEYTINFTNKETFFVKYILEKCTIFDYICYELFNSTRVVGVVHISVYRKLI